MLRLRDFSLDNCHAQVDFPKMKRGKVLASCFAFYIPADCPAPYGYAGKLRLETLRQLGLNAGVAAQASSSVQIEENLRKDLLSIVFALENGSPIGDSFEKLQEFYDYGVRYVTLTHSADNQICDSCTGGGTWGGLSPFGKKLVREMNRIGMTVDLAHCSNDTVRDVLAITQEPVVYTHGACHSLCPHRRNLPDELLKGIAQTGGVVGMSVYPLFLDQDFEKVLEDSGLPAEDWIETEFIKDPSSVRKRLAWENLQDRLLALPRPGAGYMWRHLEHALKVCGAEHVGIGTDYDGIEITLSGMETIENLGPMLEGLFKSHGCSDDLASAVMSGNFMRILG